MADIPQFSDEYNMQEIRTHNSEKSLWIVIGNRVYDVTKFLNDHPGGELPLLENAGKDATEAFDYIGHSINAKEMLKKYLIGRLKK